MHSQKRLVQNDRLNRILFYSFWIILSILQARFTELLHDEAYYWQYSNNLAWGYFDHPPAIALLIKMGYVLFNNELGVRLFIIALSTLSIYLLERLVQPTNLKLFYAIIWSIAIFQIGGIIAVPDIPLMFFAITFLTLYKKYLETDRMFYALLLGINIALLLLSKYHGILVIAFSILAVPSLLKRSSFWLMVLVSVALFSPHILWQYDHDWISFKYHLVSRFSAPYLIANNLEYLGGQLLLPGPLVGPVLLYLAFRYRVQNNFERVLKFNFTGILFFFFLMTFRGGVEMNWTVVSIFPAVYFGYKKIETSRRLKRFVYYTLPLSLILIFAVRLFLVYDFLPEKWQVETQFHGWDKWAEQIKEQAGESPVVFTNSYQLASTYAFYAKAISHSMTNVNRRHNQYDLWDYENQIQGKQVMFIPNWYKDGLKAVKTAHGVFHYQLIDNYRSFGNIRVVTENNKFKATEGQPLAIRIMLTSAASNTDFTANKDYPSFLSYQFLAGRKEIKNKVTDIQLTNSLLNKWQELEIIPPAEKGTYDLTISIVTGWFPPTANSDRIEFTVL